MHRLLRRVFTQPVRDAAASRRFAPAVVPLEDRSVPATFTVTNTLNAGAGSLRGALILANTQVGADDVVFAAGVTGTITLASALTITGPTTVTGPGAGALTVSGNNLVRVLSVNSTATATPVNISGLTIANGKATTGGAGIRSENDDFVNLTNVVVRDNATSGTGFNGGGGGIFIGTNGFLQLTNSTVSGNTAVEDGGGVYVYYNGGLNVVNSTVSGNTASTTGGIGGAGVYFFGVAATTGLPPGFTPGAVTFTNSTVSGNTSGNISGGIVANSFLGELRLLNTTVTLNSADTSGGGVANTGGPDTLILSNSVVSGNTSPGEVDVYSLAGDSIVANNSFIGDQTGLTITGANNLSGDAQLGPLQDNGGPTLTHLPLPGSPLIDAGSDALVPTGVTSDQRPGYRRITGPAVDIGATEFGSLPSVLAFAPTTPSPTNAASVVFNLVLAGPAPGLSAANFDLSPGFPPGSTIAVAPGPGSSTYTVTVSVPDGTQGTVLPRLVDATGTPGIDAAFPLPASSAVVVDRLAPTLTGFALTSPAITNQNTATYSLTFSEPVALTAANFASTPAGPAFAVAPAGPPGGYTLTVTFPAGADGTFTPTLTGAVADAAGNPVATPAAGPPVTVDRVAPAVSSVNRAGPVNTAAPTVDFVVTFSEAVAGVTSANFTPFVTGLGGAPAVTSVTGSGSTYTVTVSTGTGDGTVRLDVVNTAGVVDQASNPLAGGFAGGQTYNIIRSPAVLSIEPLAPSTTAASVDFLVTLNFTPTGLSAANFALALANGATGGPVGGTVSNVVLTGQTATVTVSNLSGTGTVRLDLVNSDGVTAPPFSPTFLPFTGGTPVAVDRDLPAVVQLARVGPEATNATTVSYTLTFSEPVTGVTAGLFAATQGGAAATVVGVTGSGANYTVTVATNESNSTLDLVLTSLTGVADGLNNPAVGAPLAAAPTRVFRIPPRVLAIALEGPATTSAATVRFVVTFSQPVFNVTAANFALAATVAGAQLVAFEPVPGDPATYLVTATTGAGDGTLALSLIDPAGIVDEVGQPVTNTLAGPAYTVRKGPPVATGLELIGPAVTNGPTGQFVVRFSEAVSGFDASDIQVVGPAGTVVSRVSPLVDGKGGSAFLIDVTYGSADGSVQVNLVDDGTIRSAANDQPLAGPADGGVRGPIVTVDRTGPVATVTLSPGQAASVVSGTVSFALSYSEAVRGVEGNLQISANGVTYTSFAVTGSGANYTVTFTGVSGRGTMTLNGAAAVDAAGNTSPPSAGATVAVTPTAVEPPPPAPVVPVAAADRNRTVVGKAVTGNVLANDSGVGLSAVLVNGPAQGRVALAADGSYTFTPNANFQGTATFTYAARSTNGLSSDPTTVTITVAPRTQLLAVGAGEGGGPVVTVYNPDGSPRRAFFAYEEVFRGGVRVATGDVNGDGVDDIITAPGRTGGPRVRVFDGVTGVIIYDFFAYSEKFTGGVYVASADVDGDGFADIVTAPGLDGGPQIQVFSGKTGGAIRNFFAYVPEYRGGVQVAAGDLDGDGFAEIVIGAATGGPHVQAYDGKTSNQVRNFFAFDPTSAGGVTVAVGDINGDGNADIITGSGADARTRVYDGRLPALLAEQGLDIPFLVGGVRVAAKDTTGDATADIIAVVPAGGAAPVVRRFVIAGGLRPLVEATPFGEFFGGLYVG